MREERNSSEGKLWKERQIKPNGEKVRLSANRTSFAPSVKVFSVNVDREDCKVESITVEEMGKNKYQR